MTHFAIPGEESSPAEAELASVLDSETTPRIGGYVLLGVLFIIADERLIILFVVIADHRESTKHSSGTSNA